MTSSTQGIQFERPIGAPADTNELEYVSALHQTNPEELRTNGTIDAKDIRNYLTSRHGIYVEPPVIQQRIIVELCGTLLKDDDDDATKPKFKKKKKEEEPMMDLCQMVSLLCIPFLRQEDINEAQKAANSLVHGMAEQVLKLILEELEHSGVDLGQFRAVDENFETGTRITPKLIRAMLDTYGEYNVPEGVLEEMVAAACPDKGNIVDEEMQHSQPRLKTKRKRVNDQVVVMLTKDSFQRALTADVQLYQPTFEHQQTTHLEDVQSIEASRDRPKHDKIRMESDFYTAPSIDQAADQYRSIIWMILLWITFILYYMCYVYDPDGWVNFQCDNNQFGCDVGASLVNWLIILAQFGICGLLYIYLGSLGNTSTKTEMGSQKAATGLVILVAMGVVVAATIVPNFVEGKAFIWDTNKADGWMPMYWLNFALGIILICIQFIRLLDNFGSLGALGVGGRTRIEQCIKLAATKKVNILVENAMVLHVAPIVAGQKAKPGGGWKFPARHASPTVVNAAAALHEDEGKGNQQYRDGSNVEALTGGQGSERAMAHYNAMDDVTETAGGVMWAYTRMADGRLFDEEGVWISARLLASTMAQWLVVAAVVVAYFVALDWFNEQKDNTVAVGQRRLEEEQRQQDELSQYVMAYEDALREKRQQQLQRHRHALERLWSRRRLQYVQAVNSTHYTITNETGVYPNLIYDANSTHFTDGTSYWPYSINSHNGTHVFDKYFPYNNTGFTDGNRFYPFSQFATNGTHITNGEYLFDGTMLSPLTGNSAVNNVEDWEFKIGISMGLVAALLATIGIAVVYIPSFVSTVIKFRSGIIKSLQGGETFQSLRESPDRATTLLGGAIWGAIFTGFFCALFVGGIAFLSVWSETRDTALVIYALLIGVLTAYLVKFLVVKLCRELYPSFFFRRHPAAVNFINVVLESWNLAVAIGTMLVRSIKLVIISAIYIGRIDVPIFAPGVGQVGVGQVGPYALDSEHFSFKKDLLTHEAHRHPYMERLGMMYLMKLHHGTNFGSQAGAYWRMLFVLALMPWMRGYRVKPNGNERPDDGDTDDEEEVAYEPTIMDDGSVMSLHGMELELDVVRRANESITLRNNDLKEAVLDLRTRLRASNKRVAQLERRAERAKSGGNASKNPGLRSVVLEQEKPVVAANDQEDDEGEFESESEDKTGPVSVEQGGETEDFEDEFEESETFTQAVRRERSKLETQKRNSVINAETKANNSRASVLTEDDFVSEDDDDDEELEDILRKRNAQAKSYPQDEEPEEFEDEFETEEEESLTHLLKKENDRQHEQERRQPSRDPD